MRPQTVCIIEGASLQRAVTQSNASTRELQRVHTRLDDLARHMRDGAAVAPTLPGADASQRDQQELARVRESVHAQRQELEQMRAQVEELAGHVSACSADLQVDKDDGTAQHAALQVCFRRLHAPMVWRR